MLFSDDMRELVLLFQKHHVEFAVCGGYAVAQYGFVRMTLDFDLLVNPTAENAEQIMKALVEFGFGQAGISENDFIKPGAAITLGEQPNQIDLLTSMSSASSGQIIKRASEMRLSDIDVKVVSYADLVAAKQEAGRAKDLIDLDELKKMNEGDGG